MDSNTLKQTRYHGLDALRGFAMILGVVIHASMFYVEGIGASLGYEMTGKVPPSSSVIGGLFLFIHSNIYFDIFDYTYIYIYV